MADQNQQILLSQPPKTKLKLEDIVKMPNVAEKLKKEELLWYGMQAVDGYNADLSTRTDWEVRHAAALKIAMQYSEKKSFPWVGASNVKFPLVTIACLQFLARIAPLTQGRDLVKVEAWGADPEGKKKQRSDRISNHMSYQLLQENRNWVDEDETAKFSAALLGCAVKKTFYDGVEGINRSEYLPLQDFVVDYFCKDLDRTPRASHKMVRFHNQITENVRRGLYCEMWDEPLQRPTQSLSVPGVLKTAQEEATGVRRAGNDGLFPYELIEQHTWLDLDGDGYAEPYIMIVRLDTKQPLRIVAKFFDEGDVIRLHDVVVRQLEAAAREEKDVKKASALEKQAQELDKSKDNKILRIIPQTTFTRFGFLPSPDGSFYGWGFGALLGPTNAAVDTIINQIINAGTLATTAGGFLGRGVKIKSGKQTFDPFEWKPVDGAGDDLRKNIVQLPVNTPPDIMFQVLNLLISYGEKLGSSTDAMTGVSPGQNTPAETSRNTLEQGMMLFSGIYKRMHRAQAREFEKMYQLNRWYIKQHPQFEQLVAGDGALFARDDYDSNNYRIFPAADPIAVSPAQKQQRAKAVFDIATASPQMFDLYVVKKRLLDAMDVEGIEELLPDPKGPKAIAPILNPKVELEKAKQASTERMHLDSHQLGMAELQAQIVLNDAKISELQAKSQKELAEAKGVGDGHQIALLEAQIGAAKAHREGLLKVLDLLHKSHEANLDRTSKQPGEGIKNDSTTKPAANG